MAGQNSVQTSVNTVQAPAVKGDFASANPRWTQLAGQGALVAGAAGVTIGQFCWLSAASVDDMNADAVVNSFGSGSVAGFVHREQQGLITAFLAASGMTIQPGMGVVVSSGGDFFAENDGSTVAQIGQKAYANLATGAVSFAATASPGTVTAATSSIAASTFSVTGSISGNLMTVTAVGSGTIVAGATISGTGITTGNMVQGQVTPLLAGEALGGIGRYYVTYGEQVVASTTISGTYGTLTLGAAPSGAIPIGALVTGTGVAAGTNVTQLLTGTGGSGSTYAVNNNTVVSSTTLTFTTTVETKWIAMTQGAVGELVKITDHPQG